MTLTGQDMTEQKKQAQQLMQRCIERLRDAGIALPDIELRFDLRGSRPAWRFATRTERR